MTSRRRDGKESPFSQWLRYHDGLPSRENKTQQGTSIADADYWIHKYRSHTDKIGDRTIDSIMCVELKTFSAEVAFSLRDTLALVNHIFLQTSLTKDGRIKVFKIRMGGEVRTVKMYGYFVLRLQGSRPDDGGWITWNGRKINEKMLVEILRFDRDPRTLRIRSERRHHAHLDQFELYLQNDCE